MKIQIEKNDFAKAIKIAKSCVHKNAFSDILKMIYIDATNAKDEVSFSGNCIETGVIVTVPCIVIEPGDICVDAETIYRIATGLPSTSDPVILEAQNGLSTLKVSCGKVKQVLPIEDGDAYIKIDESEDPAIELNTGLDTFLDAVKTVKPFMGYADNGRVMCRSLCLKVETDMYSVSAIDGFRVAYVEIGKDAVANGSFEAVIPSNHVAKLIQMLDSPNNQNSVFSVMYTANKHKLVFKKKNKYEDIYIRCATFAEKYGDIKGFFPNSFEQTIRFNRNELKEAVLRAGNFVMGNEKKPVLLDITDKGFANVSSHSSLGEYSEDIQIAPVGSTPLKMGFDPGYLVDMLNVIGEDTVDLMFKNFKSPMVTKIDIGMTKLSFMILPVNINA